MMSNEIIKLFKSEELFKAKTEVMNQMSSIANSAISEKRNSLAQNLFKNRGTEKKKLIEQVIVESPETTVTIPVKNLNKRDDIDEILQKYEHDITKSGIVLSTKDAVRFRKDLDKKRIKL